MVKIEASNEEVVLLLTGEGWGDTRLTTVKAVLDERYVSSPVVSVTVEQED